MAVSIPLAGPEAGRRHAPETPGPAVRDSQAVPWAVGTLMATTPATAYEAECILSAAAAQAGLPETVLAAAMREALRGVPVPARAERALREAVQASRIRGTAFQASGPYLLPLRTDAEKAVGRFFEARLRLTAAPADPEARRAFEDVLFTLCVLMGRPSAPQALHEAIQYTES
ncbi:uncharacterized protein DUF5133 [Streptomyces sp. KS 21]|nr:uncharacterized protein DUF5133 [Streptomyces sp. KS 21]